MTGRSGTGLAGEVAGMAHRQRKLMDHTNPRGSLGVGRLLGALACALLVAGCEPPDPPPPPPSCLLSPDRQSTATRPVSSSGAVPAEIIRDSAIYDGPGTGAGILGRRLAGTQARVSEIVGERAHIFEREDIHLASWIDLADITMALSDWERYRPQRGATLIGLYPPSATSFPTDARSTVFRTAVAFLETFLEEASPGVVLVVRTDYGSSDGQLSIVIDNVPTCPEPRDPGRKPSPFDSKRRKEYDQIVQENDQRLAEYSLTRERINSQARAQIGALLGLQPVHQSNAAGALTQISRDLAQADAPTRRIVMAVDPVRETPPSDPGIDLHGIRISLILYCAESPAACTSAEQLWRQRLAQMGALAVRTYAVSSPGLPLAFNPARPELR